MRTSGWAYLFVALGFGACTVEGRTFNSDAPQTGGGQEGKAGDRSAGAPASGGDPGAGAATSGGTSTQPQGGTNQNTAGTTAATAGGDSGAGGDPPVVVEPPIDANCGDYIEKSDIANGNELTPEDSKLTLDDELTFCGRINVDHYMSATDLVDQDVIGFEVPADGAYVITLEMLDPDLPERIELVGKEASGWVRQTSGARARAILLMPVALLGSMSFRVKAFQSAAPTHSLLYRVRVRPDDAAVRCATVAAGGASQKYAEGHDGASNSGNDLIRPDFKKALQMPTATADQAEPTGIVLDAGNHALVEGTAANVTYGQTYNDVDTYAIKTGNSTELSLRVDWTGKGADMDVMLFKENDYAQLIQTNRFTELAPELLTLAVEPQTKYWIWLGAASDVDTNGYPKAYSLSLCGAELTP